MYTEADKENIADGLAVPIKQSPKKPTKKTRNSTGGILTSPLKENAGNRRKVRISSVFTYEIQKVVRGLGNITNQRFPVRFRACG